MKINREHIRLATSEGTRVILTCMWAYTAAFKLGDMEKNYSSMQQQIFPAAIAQLLVYLIPLAAILISILLFTKLHWGLVCSAGMLVAINLYLGLALLDVFADRPCQCAGIFQSLGYLEHFMVNLLAIVLAVNSLYLLKKKQKVDMNNYKEQIIT